MVRLTFDHEIFTVACRHTSENYPFNMLLNTVGDLPISEVFVKERMPEAKSKSFSASENVSKAKLNKDIIYGCNDVIVQGTLKLSEWKDNFFSLEVLEPGSNLDAKRKVASQARALLIEEIRRAHGRLLRMREKVMLTPTTIWALPMTEVVELISLLQTNEHFDFQGVATAQLGDAIQTIVSSEWKDELNVIYHYVDSYGKNGAGRGSRRSGTPSRSIAETSLDFRGPPSWNDIEKRMESLSYVPGKADLKSMGELLVMKLMRFMRERYSGLGDEIVGIPLGILCGDAMSAMVAVHVAKYVQNGALNKSNWLAMTGYCEEDEYLIKMWNYEAGLNALMQVTQDVDVSQLYRDVLLVSLFTPLHLATAGAVDDYDVLNVWLDLAFAEEVQNFQRLGFFIELPDSRIVGSRAAGRGSRAAGRGSRAAGRGSRAGGTGSRVAGKGSRAGTGSRAAGKKSGAAETVEKSDEENDEEGNEESDEESDKESDLPNLSEIDEVQPSLELPCSASGSSSGSSSRRKRSLDGEYSSGGGKEPRINDALGIWKVCKREGMKTTTICKICREHLHHICAYGNRKFGLEHDESCSCSIECYQKERTSNTSLPDPNNAPSLA